MARPRGAGERKRRTREHVLADLSANHVEKQALLCGFAVERLRHLEGPAAAAPDTVHETRRADRRVDGRAIRAKLGITLRYPTYRQGIPASL